MNFSTITSYFLKYMVPGIITTAFEVWALILILQNFHTRGAVYLFAVGGTFVVGTTVQYFFTHRFIFHDSDREFKDGYVYFMIVALIGLVLTLFLVYNMTFILRVSPIRARVITAVIVGLWNFIGNYFISFEMHKKHIAEDEATIRKSG